MALIPVGIALGSNLGNRAAELEAGFSFLRELAGPARFRASPVIETAPVDCPPSSPAFLNAVAELELDPARFPPGELLRRLQEFERRRGRNETRGTHAPRVLDLDLIYYGDAALDEPGLLVPHPRAARRRFVLEPLAHLRPELVLPGQTQTVRQLLENLSA